MIYSEEFNKYFDITSEQAAIIDALAVYDTVLEQMKEIHNRHKLEAIKRLVSRMKTDKEIQYAHYSIGHIHFMTELDYSRFLSLILPSLQYLINNVPEIKEEVLYLISSVNKVEDVDSGLVIVDAIIKKGGD